MSTSLESLVGGATAAIDSHSEDLRELSFKIWERPELGYEEVFAHETLTNFLEQQGFAVTRGHILPTAFRASFGHNNTKGNIKRPHRFLKILVLIMSDAH